MWLRTTDKFGSKEIYVNYMAEKAVHHQLEEVILATCQAREDDWTKIVSPFGTLKATKKKFYPCLQNWTLLPAE